MNYDQILNPTIQGIKPSGIRKFFDLLEELGDGIYSFKTRVEPMYPVVLFIK